MSWDGCRSRWDGLRRRLSSWCQLKSHVTSYITSGKALQVCMLFKLDVQGNVFDSNCVEMGVEAVEMDWEDGKLQNDIKLVSIEKSP